MSSGHLQKRASYLRACRALAMFKRKHLAPGKTTSSSRQHSPVLRGSKDSAGRALFPLEVQRGVDDVLQSFGAREVAALCDVADQKHGYSKSLFADHN